MTQSKNQNMLHTQIIYTFYVIVKFLPTSGFKWIDAKEFDLNKLLAIVQEDMFSKLILNILKN